VAGYGRGCGWGWCVEVLRDCMSWMQSKEEKPKKEKKKEEKGEIFFCVYCVGLFSQPSSSLHYYHH
jgi:hypothetical protein